MSLDDVERAAERSVGWAREHGLIEPTPEATSGHRALRLADLAAGFCPDATGEGLEVLMDVLAWTAACTDRVGPGDSGLAHDLAEITRGGLPHGVSPLVSATADLWARMCEPMSDRWRARASRGWQRFLRSLLTRRSGEVPDLAGYLALRRETTALYLYLDAAERAEGYEVAEKVLATRQIQRLGRLRVDLVACVTDTDNLVLVLENEGRGTRAEVLEQIRRRVRDNADRFVRMAAEVPLLCRELGCTDQERADAQRYVRTMAHQIRAGSDHSLATHDNALTAA